MAPRPGTTSTGGDRYRRALYTFRYRSVPYPVLQTFDAPNGDFSCVRRVALEHAAAGADDAERAGVPGVRAGPARQDAGRGAATDAAAAGLCLPPVRRPQPTAAEELAELLGVARQRRTNGSPPGWRSLADWLAAADPRRPPTCPAGVTPDQLAAWTAVSRVLLNLDETITKE